MSEIEKLKKKIKELEEALEREISEKEKIASEKEKIASEKEKIASEKEKIEKEFEEFKAKHAQTVSELQKALKIKPAKKKKRKPLGAPVGHKGYARHIPERVDYITPLNPCKCPFCKTRLPKESSEIRSRYVTDIELVSKVKTTKYDIFRKYCKKCKKIVELEVPNALPHARFGLNLMLLIMYLKLGLRLPQNKVCDFLLTMYNLSIAESEVTHILKQLNRAFGEHYSHLEKMVKRAKVKYSDTTSWRINGKNYFAWVFIAYGIVLYKIKKRNNHKVPLALFGKKQKDKILVVDRHSAFRTLAEKSGFKLQLCWSHILEDSKDLSKNFGKEGKNIHKKLKTIYEQATSFNHQGTQENIEQLKKQIQKLTKTKKPYKHKTVWKFAKNLYHRDADNLFRFVTDPDIDPTNNISERELRALVIIRKISNGSRSTKGANITATLLSIIQTLRLDKKNVLQGLQDILNNPSGY